ncbi:MAG: hypothetical protein ABIH72_00370 [archaeon]
MSSNQVISDLEKHVIDSIKEMADSVEKKRAELDSRSEPCYLLRGGRWDIPLEDFLKLVKEAVLQVVKDKEEANVLIGSIFNKTNIYQGNSGGDHHTGYFQDYYVLTSPAVLLARDTEELKNLIAQYHQISHNHSDGK